LSLEKGAYSANSHVVYCHIKEEFSFTYYFQIMLETRKRNTGFYILRQGVPEGCSSEG